MEAFVRLELLIGQQNQKNSQPTKAAKTPKAEAGAITPCGD